MLVGDAALGRSGSAYARGRSVPAAGHRVVLDESEREQTQRTFVVLGLAHGTTASEVKTLLGGALLPERVHYAPSSRRGWRVNSACLGCETAEAAHEYLRPMRDAQNDEGSSFHRLCFRFKLTRVVGAPGVAGSPLRPPAGSCSLWCGSFPQASRSRLPALGAPA